MGNAPLVKAIQSNDFERAKPVVDEGTDIPPELFVLAAQKSPRIAIYMLSKDAVEVNGKNPQDGKTALHIAIQSATLHLVRALLQHRAIKINTKDFEGNPPLFYALQNRDNEIIELFLNHPSLDINESLTHGKRVVDYVASEFRNHAIYDKLLAIQDTEFDVLSESPPLFFLIRDFGNTTEEAERIKQTLLKIREVGDLSMLPPAIFTLDLLAAFAEALLINDSVIEVNFPMFKDADKVALLRRLVEDRYENPNKRPLIWVGGNLADLEAKLMKEAIEHSMKMPLDVVKKIKSNAALTEKMRHLTSEQRKMKYSLSEFYNKDGF